MSSPSGHGRSDPNDPTRQLPQDTRPEMLRLLVQEFLKRPIRNDAADARFVTLATRLLAAVDTPVAARILRELAPHPQVPRALALHVATGPLAIAGPFLRLSPALDEADLANLAEGAPPHHLAAIAARRDVSPALAKRLAELVHIRGAQPTLPVAPADDETEGAHGMETLSLSAAAAETPDGIDDETHLPASVAENAGEDRLAEAGPAQPSPDVPAAEVEQVPAPVASPDFFAATPEERAALVARLLTLPPLPLPERVPAPPPGFIDMLLDAVKAASNDDVASLLERTLGVSEANARRAVADQTGEALAVAARALGLSFAVLSRVLFRLHPVTGRSAPRMSRLAEMFDNLPTASAQHLVASWRAGRRGARERTEEAPSMRSYGNPHPAPAPASQPTDSRQRNG